MSDVVESRTPISRKDFPILEQSINEKPLIYLDNSATTQKPRSVMDAIYNYYQRDNANVHRGIYALSERSTAAYEAARQNVKNFINAKYNEEIIFTRGTTESINLIAYALGHSQIQAGDEILISGMEHHSNIVPWQIVCKEFNAKLKVIPILDDGTLDLNTFKLLLTDRVKIVSLVHVSNVLGTINPVKEIIHLAHQKNIPVLLDGAQAVPHMPVDVQDLDCDFYAFSSHKMYGPSGTGVLYGKKEWLEKLPPYQSGGDMILKVSFDHTEYNVLPHKFEAGTPNMAGVIGLSAAIDYLNDIGMDKIREHERNLTHYTQDALQKIEGLRIIGNCPNNIGVISFVMDNVHAHDVGTILAHENIAIRVGHHCAMPLMDRFGVAATARVSLGLYNEEKDIQRLIIGLKNVNEFFQEKI